MAEVKAAVLPMTKPTVLSSISPRTPLSRKMATWLLRKTRAAPRFAVLGVLISLHLATERQPFGLTYNLVAGALVNLETLFINGGTIDIVGPGELVISEIMWGSDASLDPDDANSQYIELRNTSGAEIKAAKETYSLVFYGAGVSLPDMSVAANNVQDRAGTGANGFWAAKGRKR